jgi:hypothetical protein
MPQVPPGLHAAAAAAELPLDPLEANADQPFLTCSLPHFGHLTLFWALIERTNFSKSSPHAWHVYS